MAIHIHRSKNLNSAYSDASLHLLPCKIHADGDAKVKNYFEAIIKQEKNGDLKGSFRGYPLNGKKITIPDNYEGVILHESIKPVTEDQERKFFTTHKFKSLTYWNWDKTPSKNDLITQALDWIHIAEVLHAPITEE